MKNEATPPRGPVPVDRQLESGPEPELIEAPDPELEIRAVSESIVDKQLTKDASRLMALHHSIDERKATVKRRKVVRVVLIVLAAAVAIALIFLALHSL